MTKIKTKIKTDNDKQLKNYIKNNRTKINFCNICDNIIDSGETCDICYYTTLYEVIYITIKNLYTKYKVNKNYNNNKLNKSQSIFLLNRLNRIISNAIFDHTTRKEFKINLDYEGIDSSTYKNKNKKLKFTADHVIGRKTTVTLLFKYIENIGLNNFTLDKLKDFLLKYAVTFNIPCNANNKMVDYQNDNKKLTSDIYIKIIENNNCKLTEESKNKIINLFNNFDLDPLLNSIKE